MMVTLRRGPRGPCGLKFRELAAVGREQSRGPRGPCGLKCLLPYLLQALYNRRGPRGPCGLKCCLSSGRYLLATSRPARALWIEIILTGILLLYSSSRPARALWIEIYAFINYRRTYMSRPARALWIEIWILPGNLLIPCVEAREGLVD